MHVEAKPIAEILKVLANENRLLILCELIDGPRNVGTLCRLIPVITQPALSQHLAALKARGIVSSIKSGQTVTYSIADPRVEEIIAVLKRNYCETGAETRYAEATRRNNQ